VITGEMTIGRGCGAFYGEVSLLGSIDVETVEEDISALEARGINQCHLYRYAAWQALRPEELNAWGGGGAGGGGGQGRIVDDE